MKIYLVRHGETGGNVAHRHQAEHSSLSFAGEEQVAKVAQVLKRYEPTHLVTSTLVRALETASVIGDVCDLVPETSGHFIELERPDYLYGHYHRSLKSLWFYLQWYAGLPASYQAGAESYAALRSRIQAAQAFLAQYPVDARLVVVSHSVFISLFTAHLCRQKALSPLQAAVAFKNILAMPNTHIAPIEFDTQAQSSTCAWSMSEK